MKVSKGKGNNFRNPGSIIMDRKTKDTRERERDKRTAAGRRE